MASLCLTSLETIAGGTFEEAIEAGQHVAAVLGVMVRLDVNEVTVLIHPNDQGSIVTANIAKKIRRNIGRKGVIVTG